MVQFLNGWDQMGLELQPQLYPQHLKTRPFEIRPSKSLDFKCFEISNGQISDPHCTTRTIEYKSSEIQLQKGQHYINYHNILSYLNYVDVNMKPRKFIETVKVIYASPRIPVPNGSVKSSYIGRDS